MKKYESPKMDVRKIDLMDIIATSGGNTEEPGNKNSGGSTVPVLPCFGQSGNQPAC